LSRSPGRPWLDPLWLAMGTLTAVRGPAPSHVDRRVAGAAMTLAPLAGGLLAVPALGVVLLGGLLGAPALLVAAIAVAVVALGSRGLHLDGLADTADGLAASFDRTRALAVMRRGDTGPAGAATVVLVLLIQAAGLAGAIGRGHGWAAVVLAVVTGRCVLSLACARGVPPARSEGLGATVAATVPGPVAVGVAVLALGFGAVLVTPWWLGPVAVLGGYLTAGLLLYRCVRRFGGVTGDVLGGCVEVAVLAVLVVLACR
jgi:adenosylcobinamide-GDP ribazoletransferase